METEGFTQTLGKLGGAEEIHQSLIKEIESFVCTVYGRPNMESVNYARVTLFHSHYAPKNKEEPLDKFICSDPSNFPPCHAVLLQKIKRSKLVANMWKNADKINPCQWKPEENRWKLKGEKYDLNWFDGKEVSNNVSVHINAEVMEVSLLFVR